MATDTILLVEVALNAPRLTKGLLLTLCEKALAAVGQNKAREAMARKDILMGAVLRIDTRQTSGVGIPPITGDCEHVLAVDARSLSLATFSTNQTWWIFPGPQNLDPTMAVGM